MGRRSCASREATILTHAGPEIGVASTKAFVAQVVAGVPARACASAARAARSTPSAGAQLLRRAAPAAPEAWSSCSASARRATCARIADAPPEAKGFFFLGRGINYPVALEGALKLKEISYVHAEGYPAGEMKHGPIALIEPGMPIVVRQQRRAASPTRCARTSSRCARAAGT